MIRSFRGEVVDIHADGASTWFLLATPEGGLPIRPKPGYLLRVGDVRTVEGEIQFTSPGARSLEARAEMSDVWVVPERRIFNAEKERRRRTPALRASLRPLKRAKRVAVVTSHWSVALGDVQAVLGPAGIDVVPVLAPRFAPALLTMAFLRAVNSNADAILVVRGGGSLVDLHVFNDLELAGAVSLVQREIPVVTGIGHATDSTLLDEIALASATPTAAAWRVVEANRRRR